MAQATIQYYLNEDGRKNSLLSGGNGKQYQEVTTDVTEELLKLAYVNEKGHAFINLARSRNKAVFSSDFNCKPTGVTTQSAYENIEFDHVPTVEELLKTEREDRERLAKEIADLKTKLPEEIDRYNKELEEKKLEAERKKKEAAEAERKREEAKSLARQEKEKWAIQYGSQYLKDCFTNKYKCNREYVLERAYQDYPGYLVDYKDRFDASDVISPSREALDEVMALTKKGADARIYYNNEEMIEVYYYDGKNYQEDAIDYGEVIVINDYLGKYALLKNV